MCPTRLLILLVSLPLIWATISLGCSAPSQDELVGEDFRLEPIITGLEKPLYVTSAGDGSDRLFIVEQTGRIFIYKGGHLKSHPLLDLRGRVSSGSEQGLLGLAFPPDFEASGRIYVSFTDRRGTSHLVRYRISTTHPDRLDPTSAETLLTVDQPYPNHNGGHILFGPQGYLYYGLGDGGSGHDPHNNGQDPMTLLGTILRLDVSPETGYTTPADNPFDGQQGRDEVWAYGLHNPWRFHFDSATGDLWIGDVGQDSREEVNREPAGSPGGANYGWRVWEGTHRLYEDQEPGSEVIFPVTEYPHPVGCSVIGGPMVRDPKVPTLQGSYLFGDFCSGKIWGLERSSSGEWKRRLFLDTDLAITSFGKDAEGHVYVVAQGGTIYRITAGN